MDMEDSPVYLQDIHSKWPSINRRRQQTQTDTISYSEEGTSLRGSGFVIPSVDDALSLGEMLKRGQGLDVFPNINNRSGDASTLEIEVKSCDRVWIPFASVHLLGCCHTNKKWQRVVPDPGIEINDDFSTLLGRVYELRHTHSLSDIS
jgi:hypothetical protein